MSGLGEGHGPVKIVTQKTLRGGICHKATKVSCTFELTIGLEEWLSTRGDIVPLGTCDSV